MNIRSFEDFENYIGGNEESIKGKVKVMSNSNISENSPFSIISSVEEADGMPILICGDLKIKAINESSLDGLKVYNSFNIKRGDILNRYVGENFIPKTIKNRNKVKSLSFPIVAKGKRGSNTYSSYYMFKKSENDYNSYQEKPVPRTKYDVLMFKNEPVCMYEKINDKYISKDISRDLNKQIKGISSKIMESHGLDVYHIKIYESVKGNYYLGGVSRCGDLNEKQSNLLYIKLYEDHYGYDIPVWFKNKINSLDANN